MEVTVAKKRTKTFIRWCWNQFYGIRSSIFNTGIYFESIGGTVAKIQAKMLICRLWNWFYGISCSFFFFSGLEIILSWSKVSLPRHERKQLFAGFEKGFVALIVLFLALDFILSRSEVLLPRYVLKGFLSGYETGFTAFAVLYNALWRLFWVHLRSRCQDMGEKFILWL